ncbi:hypothetical protein O3P69_012117 [Scylla paramamosain]|uniref:Uncharacterized protein n=1 Tax=Scylla paramamosain TaxID=85552 RepID=A0AAW0TCL3_SCYPA
MYCGLLCWVVLCATDGECRDALDFMSVGVLVGPPCYRQSCEDALDWMIVGVVTCQVCYRGFEERQCGPLKSKHFKQ